MSYDGKIMRRALARFSEDKQRRQNQADQRRRTLFAQEPRLAEIDRELRGTMSRIISSALRRGTDPVPAIRVIRDDNLSLQCERRELLEKLGYPADYLEERPRCPLCGDTGYRDGRVCSCLQSYYAREQIQELSRMLDVGSQSFETFRLDYYSPDRGSLSRSPRETMEHHLAVCRRYADRFGSEGGNLLLFGAPGLGKTFLSACIARVVSEDGYSVVYDTASHIFSLLEDAKFRRGDEDDEETRRLDQCDLLIIDDLGTEMNSTFVQSALYQLINGRLLGMKSTIISTNLTPEHIGRRDSQLVYSRIDGGYTILPCIGTGTRQRNHQPDSKVYFIRCGNVPGKSRGRFLRVMAWLSVEICRAEPVCPAAFKRRTPSNVRRGRRPRCPVLARGWGVNQLVLPPAGDFRFAQKVTKDAQETKVS